MFARELSSVDTTLTVSATVMKLPVQSTAPVLVMDTIPTGRATIKFLLKSA